ncbi:MAG TPA: serine/threonine-protein kinase [Tepidiformaceae bacterium]|nr:serine/threonine-protein kinase [Tepidiformaceae bacterium]
MNATDVIDRRYRLERLLGTGGMAEVWLAEDERLGRWVAVKFLREAFSAESDAGAVAAFEREARVIARLQHPNIVGVFDAGIHEGRRFIVMEYVHGYTLRELLETQGRMTEAEAIRYGLQVAAALQYAHEQGVVHCDIKPENIIINETGVAKVTDFGVAETLNRTLAPGQAQDLLGTIAYLAPEVIQGAQPDPRADVYALGLTVYEMVAGRLPFAGTSAAAIAGQRLAAPAPLLRTHARGASPELEGALAKALALSPEDRFPTAAAFAAALRRVPPTPAQAAPVVAPPGRPPQLRRRQPTARVRRGAVRQEPAGLSGATILVVIGIILIAIGVGAAAAIFLANQDEGGAPAPTPAPTTAAPTATPTPEPEPTATPARRPSPSPSPSPSPTPTPPPTPPPPPPGAPPPPPPPEITPGPTSPPTIDPTSTPTPSATP